MSEDTIQKEGFIKVGFFEDVPGSRSLGRLLAGLACISGLIIFASVSFTAIYKAVGSPEFVEVVKTILSECKWIIGLTMGGKALSTAAERLGGKTE